jgi:SAM-dependent methyltransferase
MTVSLYDALGADYDRFVDWEARLAYELPFVVQQFAQHGVRRALDLACGTGQHALGLQRAGYDVVGADPSEALIARAREHAHAAGQPVRYYRAGFGQVADLGLEPLDAITCLGNSLPHAITVDGMNAALSDMARALAPGGLLLLQMRNFDAVLAQKQRFMAPQVHRAGDEEFVFWRFYDWGADGAPLRFNMVRLQRRGDGAWSSRVDSTSLYPWRAQELEPLLREAGFQPPQHYGNLAGEPFDGEGSSDLVLVTQRV